MHGEHPGGRGVRNRALDPARRGHDLTNRTALWTYNRLLPAARAGLRLAAPLVPKLRRGIDGRRGLRSRLQRLGQDHAGRILWIHAASVGEFEQARPLVARVRERFAELEILHTFFSPSGYEYAKRLGEPGHYEYLPEDTPREVSLALDALRPRALVFMKFDLWPNLIREATRRSVPVLLFDATLHPGSWRLRWPARPLYRDVYRDIDVISAVSQEDAERFRATAGQHAAIFVDGDTRFDQVAWRRETSRRRGVLPALVREGRPFTLVAGSTWPPDESILLDAWRSWSPLPSRLVLVPHEPTPRHLRQLERKLRRAGLRGRRYSELGTTESIDVPVILVDRVGILAELYLAGDVAYVGGAFSSGVHNLLEPAIMERPVLLGPRHSNAPEARLLLESGAARVVRSAVQLRRELEPLGHDPEFRRRMGQAARACVEANRGATERCLRRLGQVLGPPDEPSEESTP